MIRILLIGYLYVEEVHLNLAYRWFCGLGLKGEVPAAVRIAFAYGTNYLIDTKAAIIVDVEPSPARWTTRVGA